MISLDSLRAAIQSDQPWNELDQLVRAEMLAGRSTKQISDELNGMWKEIDNMAEVTETGRDAFGDTLDALTGNCHRDCQYKDPPNTSLPTEVEIDQLTRWARVAFAARCARRVLPLFRYYWSDSAEKYLPALFLAVELPEKAAASATLDLRVIRDVENDAVVIAATTRAVPQAAAVARATARVTQVASDADPVAYQYADAGRVLEAVTETSEAGGKEMEGFIRRDFDHLLSLSNYFHWTDDTPVPPEVFGPLWPEGPPKGWPPITDIPQRSGISLAFFARERPTPQMIEDDIVHLFDAINRYHIARSGVPLTYEDLRSLLPALVPAEV
jgi:hypothetical protein